MFRRIAVLVATLAAVMMSFAGPAQAQDPAVLGGGSGIIIGNKLLCTITTIGHDNAGRLVGLTAGHCGGPGAPVVAEYQPDGGQVGTVVTSNRNLDYAVIEFDPARVAPVNRITNLAITSIGDPVSFPTVACKEGRTTGETCGVVWGDLLQTQETWTQACVVEGDSGAPVIVGSTLVAMVNAYFGTACFGPEIGTNLNAIMQDINASGGPGGGYYPI